MKIINSSRHPTPVVRALVRWTLAHLDCEHIGPRRPPREIRVTNCSHAFRGRAFRSDRILCRVGSSARFPTRAAEGYRGYIGWGEVNDWKEALVGLTAHELNHLDQYRRGDRRRPMYRETECDHEARRVLEKYRQDQPKVDAVIDKELSKDRVRHDRQQVQHKPESKLLHLEQSEKCWVRKFKLAETKLKDIRRRIKYYRKKERHDENPVRVGPSTSQGHAIPPSIGRQGDIASESTAVTSG